MARRGKKSRALRRGILKTNKRERRGCCSIAPESWPGIFLTTGLSETGCNLGGETRNRVGGARSTREHLPDVATIRRASIRPGELRVYNAVYGPGPAAESSGEGLIGRPNTVNTQRTSSRFDGALGSAARPARALADAATRAFDAEEAEVFAMFEEPCGEAFRGTTRWRRANGFQDL